MEDLPHLSLNWVNLLLRKLVNISSWVSSLGPWACRIIFVLRSLLLLLLLSFALFEVETLLLLLLLVVAWAPCEHYWADRDELWFWFTYDNGSKAVALLDWFCWFLLYLFGADFWDIYWLLFALLAACTYYLFLFWFFYWVADFGFLPPKLCLPDAWLLLEPPMPLSSCL